MCSSCSFTTDSFQKYPWRSCTHSKYEVVTPPALHKISGITNTRLSARISSAAAVVGPFAPSARIRHFTRLAFWLVIWFSVAAGNRNLHPPRNSSAGAALFPFGENGNSRYPPPGFLYRSSLLFPFFVIP